MDLFSTNTLIGVVQGLMTPKSFFLDRYFQKTSQDQTEEIHFDVILEKRRVTPFVSPLVAGKIVESLGRKANTFKPAYAKDKRVFDSGRAFKRAVGEKIGGALSPEERMQAHLASELADQLNMLHRRFEVMAVEAARTGKCTVVGDLYPSVVVDFGRTGSHTAAALAGNARWGQSAAAPLDNLQTGADIVAKDSGTGAMDVIMGIDAWAAFRKDAEVKSRLDTRNIVGAQLDVGAQITDGGIFRGTIDGFNIFTYSGWWVDPADNTEKVIFPANEILMGSAAIEGVRAFGAIRDEEAGFQALEYFPKSWIEKDPAIRYLLLQSAPLMVPTRPDATYSRKVLD
jgi:hypothetical protein